MVEWAGAGFWRDLLLHYPPKRITFEQEVRRFAENREWTGVKVLDYCCGTGQVGEVLKEAGANVTGIDCSPTLLREAEKRIDVVECDALSLPFEDESFDYALALMCLHILPLDESIAELHRVLRKGGGLFVGIVSPYAEFWNEEAGRYLPDYSGYLEESRRVWAFNLDDGRRYDAEYYHRPLEAYIQSLSKHFALTSLSEPQLPKEFRAKGRYATYEYLFMNANNVRLI